ncbi:hypothetical protein HDU76_008158 [Blyttiomyces sp. JEL0837]|nr:hypothetical protein HDU76_008158 [Blyttiomyces sp. JEL0837]
MRRVLRIADGAVADNRTYSVVEKLKQDITGPSGDPHDYYSMARYYWPNKTSPTGLPYIRIDGQTNPERNAIPDSQFLQIMINDVFNTALAYFFTGNKTYSDNCVRRLRDWFINNGTRMNPNLLTANYVKGMPFGIATLPPDATVVPPPPRTAPSTSAVVSTSSQAAVVISVAPGTDAPSSPSTLAPNTITAPATATDSGDDEDVHISPIVRRGIRHQADTSGGLLDLSKMYLIIDAVGIIRPSGSLTLADESALQQWFSQYLNWLITSNRGIAEEQALNNQGTWFDVQLVSLLLFLNQTAQATAIVQNSVLQRISEQVTPTGMMPLEMARPLSWFYTQFGLQAFFVLAELAKTTGISLLRYQTQDGKSLMKVLDFVIPYAKVNGTGWPFNNTLGGNVNVTAFQTGNIAEMCKQAYITLRDDKYWKAARDIQGGRVKAWNPSRLWAPYDAYDAPAARSGAGRNVALVNMLWVGGVWAFYLLLGVPLLR